MKIFQLSPFVENQFEHSPELNELISGEFDLLTDWNNYQSKNPHLDIFALLRKYRQTRLALIAARDLENTKFIDHIQTLKKTSQLAKLLITQAYQYANEEFKSKYGTVLNQKQQPQTFVIYALGKLGGKELNYSSDVDLVFCYSGAGESDGKRSLDAQSYYQRLGRRIIQILDNPTHDGIVYRVDMRLRPFGSAAPLVCSVDNLQNYLEAEGRDWERYAWLRAGFIAGNKALAQETLNNIQPFIYRKYLDYNIFESLRQIKQQITRNQIHDLDNIKLGKGGIREIEFIVQTLQLTFAGRNQQLRGNDLWEQLHNLNTFNHLTSEELQQLTSAWLFLRKLENLCQIIHDNDTHHLPEDLEAISSCMNFSNSKDLMIQINQHRKNVHSIFEQLFVSNQQNSATSVDHPLIQAIKDEVSNRKFPKANRHKIYAALDAIVPLLNGDNDEEIINRYQQVVNAISKRMSYLSMLIESPFILKKLKQQLSYSQYFSNRIAKNPSLLELLFENIDDDDFDFDYQWQLLLKKHPINDSEQYLNSLCEFKQSMQFKAIMAYIDEINNANRTSENLSKLAEFILSQVVQQALEHVQKDMIPVLKANDLIIIAYGSLAMKNMHLQSDFDIVFILDHEINDNNHRIVMRWIKRIIHLLSIQTYSGTLYKLDTQLRPNGKSGAAIVTKTSFEDYQRNEAWLWEHAALIKSRAVYATKNQRQWFEKLREQILCQKREPSIVNKELTEMAERLRSHGKTNHQQEFKDLEKILIHAHEDSSIIKNIMTISNEVSRVKSKLDRSIYE